MLSPWYSSWSPWYCRGMNPHLVYRVTSALAEWANDNKVGGLTSWDPNDFTPDAEKFVTTLENSVQWHEETKREPSEESYRADILGYLDWSVSSPNDANHGQAIEACLFEVGPDLTGLDFDNG